MAGKRYRVIVLAAALLTGGAFQLCEAGKNDPLLAGFKQPPPSAHPRVWWHWMNGNITEDGIAKDIEWMQRVGIGGMQAFDASLDTPQVVDKRLAYMTPQWKEAFRLAATRAEADGLELGIAGSPGWSETGGPWVAPEDGMKKLVWSKINIDGGQRFTGKIPAPPTETGPYQTMAAEDLFRADHGSAATPELYHDVAVLAFPIANADDLRGATIQDGVGRELNGALLADGEYDQSIDLGSGIAGQPPSLSITYPSPRLVKAAVLFMREALPSFNNPRFSPVLEAEVGGGWQKVGEFDLAAVPTTIAFAPVTSAKFRVIFGPYTGPQRPALTAPAPGVIVPAFMAPDIGVHPAKVAEFRLFSDSHVDHSEAKAGYALANDYLALTTSAPEHETGTPPAEVLNVSSKLRPDGTLDWIPPKGKWQVIRIGWSLTGQTNHPASPEATGLEVDKLDGAAVERYLRHYLDMYKNAVGDGLFGAHGVRAMVFDSTEVGTFNWTPRMIDQFRQLRGYDPIPWMPALTGHIIGSRSESDHFLYDFRRTISELHATEHYATVARVAHDYGLTVYGEALEDQRPVLGDDMAMRRHADVPMAALWVWSDKNGPRPTLLGDMKGASSVAHLYGKTVVAAESMTSALAPWANAPAELRRVVDLEFAHGINRPVIHTSVHQPLDDKIPGLSLMVFGQFFNRHETWAEMARPWIDYISRSSFLLQQGRNVADVAYFYGEESPITALNAFGSPDDLPVHYASDYVNAEAINSLLNVQGGDLVSPFGARYRALFLGHGSEHMTLPTLRRIAALVAEGATVVGRAPVSSPSLHDDAREYAALCKKLWPGVNVNPVGKGRIIESRDVESALAAQSIAPDVEIEGATGSERMMFVHRQLDDGDLYFVVNREKSPQTVRMRFRVRGKAAEIWRADTGRVTDTTYQQDGDSTVVPLELAPEDSLFVVFRKSAAGSGRVVQVPALTPILDVQSPWTISFQSGRGAPTSIELPSLASLSEQKDPRVRYFSGEATYATRFAVSKEMQPGSSLWLDLGQVGDLAEVEVNGKKVGSPWHAPYRVQIGGAVVAGENSLVIKVADLWVNRLVGDAQPGVSKLTFTTFPTYRADAPLRPSGLIGPVRLMAETLPINTP